MANMKPVSSAREFDLARDTLRQLNLYLHRQAAAAGVTEVHVRNPDGAHSVACGLDAELDVQIHGHVGYYVAGMNKHASVTVFGNAGPGRRREHDVGPRARARDLPRRPPGASAHGGLLDHRRRCLACAAEFR